MLTPGRETSEWRITSVVVALTSLLSVLQLLLPQGSALYSLVGVTLATLAALGYTVNRGMVKAIEAFVSAMNLPEEPPSSGLGEAPPQQADTERIER